MRCQGALSFGIDRRIQILPVHIRMAPDFLPSPPLHHPQLQVRHGRLLPLLGGSDLVDCMPPECMATLNSLRCRGTLPGLLAHASLHLGATHPSCCPSNPIHSAWPCATPHHLWYSPLQHRTLPLPVRLGHPRGRVSGQAGAAWLPSSGETSPC